MNNELGAKLVWDGGQEIHIPEEMGTPKETQLMGTVAENLTELAGRVCYDSLGKGRDSKEYHKHILEVGHLSVLEHFNYTVRILDADLQTLAPFLVNRPGVWVEQIDLNELDITLNLRSAVEFNQWKVTAGTIELRKMGAALMEAGHRLAPNIVQEIDIRLLPYSYRMPDPMMLSDEQKWISIYMKGSRGFSHEQVRHKFRTAVSQRSTRYVDESESPWVEHPLLQEFWNDESNEEKMMDQVRYSTNVARDLYDLMVGTLQPWLIARGVDKFTARKQSRGAARGYLGNALHTEMIFSASVAQWKRMLDMRCSPHADAEIRAIFSEGLKELKSSRYGHCFEGFELQDAPDGIGQIAVETGA